MQFFYDKQIRRYLVQIIRVFSNFTVKYADGTLHQIPVMYGDADRQAAVIMRQNSENVVQSVPRMAVYITDLSMDRSRLGDSSYVGKIHIRERDIDTTDPTNPMYTGGQGKNYTVERLMPTPFKLTVKVDIWAANTEQKFQILEQILVLFNPSLEIQSTDNYIDWSSLSVVLLTDVANTSRSIPSMSEESIDIATLTFELPIWITLPAKVKKMGVVAQIIASIYDATGDVSPDFLSTAQGLMFQQRFTPMNYKTVLLGNKLILYKETTTQSNNNVYGAKVKWRDLVNLYGTLTNGISQVRLTFEYPDGQHEIVGTVAYDPTDDAQLLFTPFNATLPANTLDAVTAIIDPYNVTVDSNILSPATGTRYLILNPIGDVNSIPATAWAGTSGTNLVANANDIIEWNGSYWTVSFDSVQSGIQYVSNLTTTVQYRWTGQEWTKSYEGLYSSGSWSLVL